MADKLEPRRGGDGRINLDLLEEYADVETPPELLKALLEVEPEPVEQAVERLRSEKPKRRKAARLGLEPKSPA